MIFKEAMLSELIERNPAALVPLPRYEPEEPKGVYLTAQEANEVLQLFRGHQLQPLLLVTLYYGLRRSEVLGLK
jgi:integrase